MGCGSGACTIGASCGSGGACGSGGSCGSAWDGTFRDVVGVRLNHSAKTSYHDSTGLFLTTGDHVIVEADGAEQFATVILPTGPSRKFAGAKGLPAILRRATSEDLARNRQNRQREDEAFEFCQARVRQRHLEMKLVHVQESFDRRKLTFYFTSEGRVDFRDLVKELAQQFRSRIEMRQIGPRDEAKVLGGYGDCGRPLCCTTFLKEFAPISIRMARRQGLSLNPSKISGRCGRLKCCLKYEDTGDDLPHRPPAGAPTSSPEPAPPAA